MRHNGEPNLSLLGGPHADITPANLLKKLMVKWSEEAEESYDSTAPGFGACAGDAVMPEHWEEAGGSGGATAQEGQGGWRRGSRNSDVTAAGRKGADHRRRRTKKSLKPNAEAVSMANQGLHFSFASCCMAGQLHQVWSTIYGCSVACKSCCFELVTCSMHGVTDQVNIPYTQKQLIVGIKPLHKVLHVCVLMLAVDSMLCQQKAILDCHLTSYLKASPRCCVGA